MQLKLDGIDFSYGKNKILENINIFLEEADRGRLIMLAGLNGCGKTTLLKLMCGFIKPSAGSITLGEKTLQSISVKECAKYISYLPQNPSLDLKFTVYEYTAMGLNPHLDFFEIPKQDSRITDALLMYNIEHLKHRKMDTLSGGQQKICALARICVQDTRYIFMDEPLASLDYPHCHDFLCKLKNHLKESGACAVMSLHEPSYIAEYADRTIVIKDGKNIADIINMNSASAEELYYPLKCIYGEKFNMINANGKIFYTWG